ncbi:hypothetical protein B0T14DRAFT_508232 [Immersiella caudata]|uniref:Uncharacterized protein n=1 Tax=Immersiella caudata TaxID=314043 RepID=A0AA39XI30_9PEZI|nr:hypothetical protein B0T14DRAFT_508232 [Immersiella caudata]
MAPLSPSNPICLSSISCPPSANWSWAQKSGAYCATVHQPGAPRALPWLMPGGAQSACHKDRSEAEERPLPPGRWAAHRVVKWHAPWVSLER